MSLSQHPITATQISRPSLLIQATSARPPRSNPLLPVEFPIQATARPSCLLSLVWNLTSFIGPFWKKSKADSDRKGSEPQLFWYSSQKICCDVRVEIRKGNRSCVRVNCLWARRRFSGSIFVCPDALCFFSSRLRCYPGPSTLITFLLLSLAWLTFRQWGSTKQHGYWLQNRGRADKMMSLLF